MILPFNELSPAEVERLACLAEEMGEVIQVIGKILRHGYASTHPNGGATNRELLQKELGDVKWAVHFLYQNNDVVKGVVQAHSEGKAESVKQYLHEQ